jgi:hypothetical protein
MLLSATFFGNYQLMSQWLVGGNPLAANGRLAPMLILTTQLFLLHMVLTVAQYPKMVYGVLAQKHQHKNYMLKAILLLWGI